MSNAGDQCRQVVAVFEKTILILKSIFLRGRLKAEKQRVKKKIGSNSRVPTPAKTKIDVA